MSEHLLRRLADVDARAVLAGMFVLVTFIAFESWMLVVRTPLAELQALVMGRTSLRPTPARADVGAETERLFAETDANARAIAAAMPTGSADVTVLALMETLGRIASLHTVSLSSVKIGKRAAVAGFEEQAYEVEARGSYLALHAWLSEARLAVSPLVIGGFTLRSLDQGMRVGLTLRLTSYRPAPAARTVP